MNRRTFTYKLEDGNSYVFSERNREDVDYVYLFEKIRKAKFEFIQENVKDAENQFTLLMQELHYKYTGYDILEFFASNPDYLIEAVYNSFKIANPGISLDKFKELCGAEQAKKLMKLINEVETEEEMQDAEIIRELKIKEDLWNNWKKNHPEVIESIRKRIKKKQDKG